MDNHATLEQQLSQYELVKMTQNPKNCWLFSNDLNPQERVITIILKNRLGKRWK